MVKSKRTSYEPRYARSLEDLLRLIPTEVFVGAVNKSGLPTAEARELCDKFKELKG